MSADVTRPACGCGYDLGIKRSRKVQTALASAEALFQTLKYHREI